MYVLTDKVVAITGASRGIGAAVAAAVLADGAKHVRILDVDEVGGVQLQDKLNETYGTDKAKFVKCDVTEDQQILRAIEDTRHEQGFLDVMINNAGMVLEGDYKEIRKTIEINLIALINGTHKAIELMDKRNGGRGGAIINISSTAGLYPSEVQLFTYSATKAAVIMFSEIIGQEPMYSDTGVRVMALCYGCTSTPILDTVNTFGKVHNEELNNYLIGVPKQSAQDAARGTIEVYKKGKAASVWVININSPSAVDYTEERTKFYQIMIEKLNKKGP